MAAAATRGRPPSDAALETDGVPWPEPLGEVAMTGLAGEAVRRIEPETESDAAAILVQLLVSFGNAIGRRGFFRIEADLHYPNLFCVLVGRTAKGRKGTSWGRVLALLEAAGAGAWSDTRVEGGLSSGEGLIWAVRDPIVKKTPIKERGRITGYQEEIADEGVADKRLLVVESEFARLLRTARREGNTLTDVLRQAWDSGKLRTMTKNSPARATGAHISIVGHVTQRELIQRVSDTDAHNGFLNRFLWVCVRRSKLLPHGGRPVTLEGFAHELAAAVGFGSQERSMAWSPEARQLWEDEYERLTADRLGLFGLVTGRAEAQVLRLSMVYALLAQAAVIDFEHLKAALEVWRYCEDSARHIFGERYGVPLLDELVAQLRAHPEGLTRAELIDYFCRHVSGRELTAALETLRGMGQAREVLEQTGGRSARRWFANDPARKAS
jgi:hypothetical protein